MFMTFSFLCIIKSSKDCSKGSFDKKLLLSKYVILLNKYKLAFVFQFQYRYILPKLPLLVPFCLSVANPATSP